MAIDTSEPIIGQPIRNVQIEVELTRRVCKDQMHSDALSIPVEAVRLASRFCAHVGTVQKGDVAAKGDLSPVTIADYGSQAIICRSLAQSFPDTSVIAEESSDLLRENADLLKRVVDALGQCDIDANGDDVCQWIDHGRGRNQHQTFWTLDPIDGTKGFLRNDQYAIALAKVENGTPTAAVLGCPNLVDPSTRQKGLILTAAQGQGAHVHAQDQTPEQSRPLHVSASGQPSDARFCESVESGHSNHSVSAQLADCLGITHEPLRIDSQCKYAAVAAGWADIYLRLTRGDYLECIWDHAAGCLVVTEAGGTVTDLNGRALAFDHGHRLKQNHGVVATNGLLHDQVIQGLAELI